MEKEEDEGCRWPEDMERRRIAALQKFQRKNPDFMHFLELPTTNKNGSRAEKSCPSSARRLSSALARKGRPSRPENRWCLATTLELLEQMKVFVRANKLPCIGECMVKWKAVAVNLSNPCSLELGRLARSSMVRFDNLRRTYRAGKLDKIEVEVQDSMIEYFKILELHQTWGSKKSSLRPRSTMDLALRHNKSSARPQPTRAPARDVTGRFCRRQTPMEGGALLHDESHDTMPSGDESFDCSDDYDNELLIPTSQDMETQVRILPPPGNKRETIDKEDASGNYGPYSQMDQDRLRPSSVPGTRTGNPLLRGSSRRTLTF